MTQILKRISRTGAELGHMLLLNTTRKLYIYGESSDTIIFDLECDLERTTLSC